MLYSMKVGGCNFGAFSFHPRVTNLLRQPSLLIQCIRFESGNVSNAYKRIHLFSAASYSRETRQTRERSIQPIIYEHLMMDKHKSAKTVN